MTPARPRVAEMTVTSHQDITGSDWHGQMESADQDSHQSMLPPGRCTTLLREQALMKSTQSA